MEKTYLRGEIYYADLGQGKGSEQSGFRPVVIIQNDIGNKYSPTVIVAPTTTQIAGKLELPVHLLIECNCGLRAPSIVLFEHIRAIHKSRLRERIGRLSKKDIERMDKVLAVSVGINIKKNIVLQQ